MNLIGLQKEISYKWKVQSAKEKIVVCVPYIDARDAQALLDDVCEPFNWSETFRRDEKGILICGVSIYDKDKDVWVTKEDAGTPSYTDAEKGEYSDAFKRACVHWGVGRFLYHIPNFKIFNTHKITKRDKGKEKVSFLPCDDYGNVLWDGEQLTEYINSKRNQGQTQQQRRQLNQNTTQQQNNNNGKSKQNTKKQINTKPEQNTKGVSSDKQKLLKKILHSLLENPETPNQLVNILMDQYNKTSFEAFLYRKMRMNEISQKKADSISDSLKFATGSYKTIIEKLNGFYEEWLTK